MLDLGFEVVSTPGTLRYLFANGIEDVEEVQKIKQGSPNILDLMIEGRIQLVMNTPSGRGTQLDEAKIRKFTIERGIPCITTIPAAREAVNGIRALKKRTLTVRPLQEYFPRRSPN